jgi:16S rRNA (guanine527-N7)-methyltransferase
MVHRERIEVFARSFRGGAEVVCARAVSRLNSLIGLCFPLLAKTASIGLFPKGKEAETELAEASLRWKMDATLVGSRTDPKGRIVVVRDLEARGTSP